jgi:hypothetical protein
MPKVIRVAIEDEKALEKAIKKVLRDPKNRDLAITMRGDGMVFFTLKDPRLKPQKDLKCFLYGTHPDSLALDFLKTWLKEDKFMDIYEFTGRFGSSVKCPWCGTKYYNLLEEHMEQKHKKTSEDLNTIKLSQKTYSLLLNYLRNRNYETLAFYIHRVCAYCEKPNVKGREGKCAIPESARNKMRSIKELGLTFNGFNPNNYSINAVAMVYKKRPVKRRRNANKA